MKRNKKQPTSNTHVSPNNRSRKKKRNNGNRNSDDDEESIGFDSIVDASSSADSVSASECSDVSSNAYSPGKFLFRGSEAPYQRLNNPNTPSECSVASSNPFSPSKFLFLDPKVSQQRSENLSSLYNNLSVNDNPTTTQENFDIEKNASNDDNEHSSQNTCHHDSRIKMVRMYDSETASDEISYDTHAFLSTDIDSIVIQDRFFANIGLILLKKGNSYTLSNVLKRNSPNNSSRLVVTPSPSSENCDEFYFTKCRRRVKSIALHDFPNVVLGKINIDFNIELKIHFSLIKHDVYSNYFTIHQITTIAAALNAAKSHYKSATVFRNCFRDPQSISEINSVFQRLNCFIVPDERNKNYHASSQNEMSSEAGFSLLLCFEYFLRLMAQGPGKWKKKKINFPKLCGNKDLMYSANIETVLTNEATYLYNNRHWYFQVAGTKAKWPKTKPTLVKLSDSDSVEKVMITRFGVDHSLLDTKILSYGPFTNNHFKSVFKDFLHPPHISFDHAVNFAPRNEGISFVTCAKDVTRVLKSTIKGDFSKEYQNKVNLFASENDIDYYPLGLRTDIDDIVREVIKTHMETMCPEEQRSYESDNSDSEDEMEFNSQNDSTDISSVKSGARDAFDAEIELSESVSVNGNHDENHSSIGVVTDSTSTHNTSTSNNENSSSSNEDLQGISSDLFQENFSNMSINQNAQVQTVSQFNDDDILLDSDTSSPDTDDSSDDNSSTAVGAEIDNKEPSYYLERIPQYAREILSEIPELTTSHFIKTDEDGNEADGVVHDTSDYHYHDLKNHDDTRNTKLTLGKFFLWMTHGQDGIANAHSGKHQISAAQCHEDSIHLLNDFVQSPNSSPGDEVNCMVIIHDDDVQIAGGQVYNSRIRELCEKKPHQKMYSNSNLIALMLEVLMTHDIVSRESIIPYSKAKKTILEYLPNLGLVVEDILYNLRFSDRNEVRFELFFEVGDNANHPGFPHSENYHELPLYPGACVCGGLYTRCIKAVRHSDYYRMVKQQLEGPSHVLSQVLQRYRNEQPGVIEPLITHDNSVRAGVIVAFETILGCIDMPTFVPKNLYQFRQIPYNNPIQAPPFCVVPLDEHDRSIFNQTHGFSDRYVVKRRHMTKCNLGSSSKRGSAVGNARNSVTSELQALVRDPINANMCIDMIDRVFFSCSSQVKNNILDAEGGVSLFYSYDAETLPLGDKGQLDSFMSAITDIIVECVRTEFKTTVWGISTNSRTNNQVLFIPPPQDTPLYEKDAAAYYDELSLHHPSKSPYIRAMTHEEQISFAHVKRSNNGFGYSINSAGRFFFTFLNESRFLIRL